MANSSAALCFPPLAPATDGARPPVGFSFGVLPCFEEAKAKQEPMSLTSHAIDADEDVKTAVAADDADDTKIGAGTVRDENAMEHSSDSHAPPIELAQDSKDQLLAYLEQYRQQVQERDRVAALVAETRANIGRIVVDHAKRSTLTVQLPPNAAAFEANDMCRIRCAARPKDDDGADGDPAAAATRRRVLRSTTCPWRAVEKKMTEIFTQCACKHIDAKTCTERTLQAMKEDRVMALEQRRRSSAATRPQQQQQQQRRTATPMVVIEFFNQAVASYKHKARSELRNKRSHKRRRTVDLRTR